VNRALILSAAAGFIGGPVLLCMLTNLPGHPHFLPQKLSFWKINDAIIFSSQTAEFEVKVVQKNSHLFSKDVYICTKIVTLTAY
jgi:hypothetical protein